MPLTRDNITLNAYLIPLFEKELRKKVFSLCRDAEIDILSHVYPTEHWMEETHTFEWYRAALAEADEYGMKMLAMDTDIQHLLGKSRDEVKAIAGRYKNLPGLAGYFVVDEPYNPDIYAYIDNAIAEVVPDAYINVNFFPGCCYPEGQYVKQLADYGAITGDSSTLSLDVYCYGNDGGVNGAMLYGSLNDQRLASLRTGHNTAVYVQSVGLKEGYRRPEPSALRHNIMTALAYGIKEIKFFTWGTPPEEEGNYSSAVLDREYQPTDLYYAVKDINHKVHSFGKTLAHCDAVAVYFSDDAIEGITETIPQDFPVKTDGKYPLTVSVMRDRINHSEQYLMLVNNDFGSERTFGFSVEGADKLLRISDDTGEAEEIPGPHVIARIEAGGAALYRLPDNTYIQREAADGENLIPYSVVRATSSLGTENRYIYNCVDGVIDGSGARISFADGCEQNITFDLGRKRRFNRLDVYPVGEGENCGSYYPKKFVFEISDDGINWKKTAEYRSEGKIPEEVPVFEFDTVNAEYARIVLPCTDGIINFAEIGEILLYLDDGTHPKCIKTGAAERKAEFSEGEDIALHKPVIAWSSTTDQPAWNCSHEYLTDGSEKVWASGLFLHDSENAEEWIVVDLGAVYNVNSVKLLPQEVSNGTNVFPKDYEILLSEDGINSVTAVSTVGDEGQNDSSARSFEFSPVPARFVKFRASRLSYSSNDGNGYMVELRELEVYAAQKVTDVPA